MGGRCTEEGRGQKEFSSSSDLAQAALGLHEGGPPSSGSYWSLGIG